MSRLRHIFLLLFVTSILISCQDQPSQETSPAVLRLTLSGPAKRFCSGIWVSERGREEALYNSVLWNEQLLSDYEAGRLSFKVEESRRVVTASREGVSASARFFGDQGCVILRPETDKPMFVPREVSSSLPNPESTFWPMGDKVPEVLPSEIDFDLLDEAENVLFSNSLDRRAALVVVHKGQIVKESYSSGAHAGMQLESWSMGKSMTATLIGRLIQMGHLELWQRAPVPRWQNTLDDPRGEIRIADLLRMSSGLRFSRESGSTPEQKEASYIQGQDDHRMGYVAPIDVFQFSTSRELEHPPNSVGRYRNSDPWTLGLLIRRTVENVLKEEYLTWPQRELFDKIGIRRFVAETDIYGNFILTGYNFGTARDWARFGQLYLQEGMWEGEQVIPKDFVEFVQTPAPGWPEPIYGGLFWLNTADQSGRGQRIPTLPTDTYNAAGAGDQYTYIIPSHDLVIVVMSHRGGASLSPDRRTREHKALGLIVKSVNPEWASD